MKKITVFQLLLIFIGSFYLLPQAYTYEVYKKKRKSYRVNAGYSVRGKLVSLPENQCRLFLSIRDTGRKRTRRVYPASITLNERKGIEQNENGFLFNEKFGKHNMVAVMLRTGRSLRFPLHAESTVTINTDEALLNGKTDVGKPLKINFKVEPDKGQRVTFKLINRRSNTVFINKAFRKKRVIQSHNQNNLRAYERNKNSNTCRYPWKYLGVGVCTFGHKK